MRSVRSRPLYGKAKKKKGGAEVVKTIGSIADSSSAYALLSDELPRNGPNLLNFSAVFAANITISQYQLQ